MLKTRVKLDFPIFSTQHNLCYLDSAATALKPQVVIDAITSYYRDYSANVFRGLYPLSEKATSEFEQARENIARFINAKDASEIIFVRNTTEAVNLLAYSWGRLNIGKGDEIVVTIMEHHSNFVPWQQLAIENGAIFKIIDITNDGRLDIQEKNSVKSSESKKTHKKDRMEKKYTLDTIISNKTKIVALTHVSNVLGTINPIKEIIAEVKRINPSCLVFVDGAQAIPHRKVDVLDLGADFYAFSGHKMLGPTGVGVLWGKSELLRAIPPFIFGGSMIEQVTLTETKFRLAPLKFEAGTPHIAGAIGLSTAISYLEKIGIDTICSYEEELTQYALLRLSQLPYVHLLGSKELENRAGVLSFTIEDSDHTTIHPHDAGQILSDNGVCIRAGHHCAMPLHNRLGVPGSVRASLYLYNTKEDVDHLVKAIQEVKKIFK